MHFMFTEVTQISLKIFMHNLFILCDCPSATTMDYAPWKDGEPNDMGGREYYIALLHEDRDWGMVDVEKSIYIRSICEKDASLIAPGTSPIQPTPCKHTQQA